MAENTTKAEGTSESQHSNNAVLGAVALVCGCGDTFYRQDIPAEWREKAGIRLLYKYCPKCHHAKVMDAMKNMGAVLEALAKSAEDDSA